MIIALSVTKTHLPIFLFQPALPFQNNIFLPTLKSMVGYILGLGDRHPSNLMIDRKNGYIMHVDFGDCFEVAITRDRFPECVPFRLTRMLVSALEISGVHGTFRITCENTMAVLRDNADSVMAVLEAFVHDPLIDWFTKNQQRKKGWG